MTPFDQEAAAIIVALALDPGPAALSSDGEHTYCVLCSGEGRTPLADPVHRPECVWLRAKALMADRARTTAGEVTP